MMDEKLDYKKEYPHLYMPKAKPSIVDVPPMHFIMVDGKGNPNTQGGEYRQAVEVLYAVSYAIKMSKIGAGKPDGYFEYVVPPFEVLWWLEDGSGYDISKKDKFCWTSMIRQPEFVTQEVFEWACKEIARKKPQLDTSKARLQAFHEGLCVQMMHIGAYDDERATIDQIKAFIKENRLQNAVDEVQPDGTIKRHHELYLSDPAKVAPQKLKTILRHLVIQEQGLV